MQTAVLRGARKTSAAGRRGPLRVLLAGKASRARFCFGQLLMASYQFLIEARIVRIGLSLFRVSSASFCSIGFHLSAKQFGHHTIDPACQHGAGPVHRVLGALDRRTWL